MTEAPEYSFRREGRHPTVSVVIPAWREERGIVGTLAGVVGQTYPADRLEIIVVVGASSDRTGELAEDAARTDDRIRVIHNPDPRTPVSLNLGIRSSRGAIIARVDAHGRLEPHYLEAGVRALQTTGADAVGGVVSFEGEGTVGSAIALAMGSRLGAGTAAFRSAAVETRADGLMWGMFPRELFDWVGLFDEELLRNQDDELCYRIAKRGGVMVITPSMRFTQQARRSLPALWSQYKQWGWFRFATMRKHRRPATTRQLAPPTLVATLGLAMLVTPLGRRGRLLGAASLAGYTGVLGIAAGRIALQRGRPGLVAPTLAAMSVMQIAYGTGFWAALLARPPADAMTESRPRPGAGQANRGATPWE